MGRNDYRVSTYNYDNRGKFLRYFEDNECDSDDIGDELGEDVTAADCAYIEFDDTFPINPAKATTAEQRQEEIFLILQNCWKYGKAYPKKSNFVLTENFMRS